MFHMSLIMCLWTFIKTKSIQTMLYDKGYYIDCEFTLSRKIAVKSLMTNPNTNIRDYGIPQKL